MKDISLSRRAVMLGVAALPMAQQARRTGTPEAGTSCPSANAFNGGVNCCAKAHGVIKAGGDTLDAVIAGVNIVELDPRDTSVGYGGLPNEDGVVELDASCIHGPTRRGGAVGAIARHQDAFEDRPTGDGRDRPHDAGGRGRAALRQGVRLSRKRIC